MENIRQQLRLPKISGGNSRMVTEYSTSYNSISDTILSKGFAKMMKKIRLNRKEIPLTKVDNSEDELDVMESIEDHKKNMITLNNKRFLRSIYEQYEKTDPNMRESDDKEEVEKEDKVNEMDKNDEFNKTKYGFEQFGSTNYVSKSAMGVFYNKYQKYNILSRKHKIKNFTPSFAFIKASNEEKIVPNPKGLIKRKGFAHDLEMRNQLVGDRYMRVLSESLKYRTALSTMNFSNNRMSFEGAKSLFNTLSKNKSLTYQLRSLDLSNNFLGSSKKLDEMIAFLTDDKCSIENINLYGNLLGNKNTIRICETLSKYGERRMNDINLGKNNIDDEVIPSICELLNNCIYLKAFSLNKNWIHNKGASEIIKTLTNHGELRLLDLSYNCIGNDLILTPSYEEVVNTDYKNPNRLFNNFALDETLTSMKLTFRRNPLLPNIDQKANPKKNDNKKDDKKAVKPVTVQEPKKIAEKPKTPSAFAVALANYFCSGTVQLIHLDISNNNLNYIDCNELSDKIKQNHIILGIHVDGNEMDVDALGFLHPMEKSMKNEKFFSRSQIHYDMNIDYALRKTNNQKLRKLRDKNKCWICEGFREVLFTFIPKKTITDPTNTLVKVHLSCDDYKPFDMICSGNKYEIVRMCPPGELMYFFTVNTKPIIEDQSGKNNFIKLPEKQQIEFTFDDEYMEELNNVREKLKYQTKKLEQEELEDKEKLHRLKYTIKVSNYSTGKKLSSSGLPNLEESAIKNLTAKKLNFVNTVDFKKEAANIKRRRIQRFKTMKQSTGMLNSLDVNDDLDFSKRIKVRVEYACKTVVKVNKNVVNEEFRKTIKYTEPRPEKIINKFVRPRTPWKFGSSIWAYYGYDYDDVDEDYLDKCFLFDFDRCQFTKDFKDENKLFELKLFLRKNYRNIIDCYKYYSSLSGFQLWQIGQNSLTEFILSKCDNFVDKSYDINNVYLTQKVVCGNLTDKEDRKKGNKNLCDNIVRHQFMNLLVKVAKDKYITCLKTTTDPLEAVKMAFASHFDSAIQGFEYHKWRQERYYNEQVDNFLKAYLPILDALYVSWTRQKGPRKKDIWMYVDEFNTFINNLVDINDYPIRENSLVFAQAIPLQINEIYTDRHLNMFLPEFLEALCRAVDKASPIPPADSPDDWPKEKRASQPLINKLENIMPTLIKMITHPDYKTLKEKFPLPVKNLSTDLYNINYDTCSFYNGYQIHTNPEETKKVRKPSSILVLGDKISKNNASLEVRETLREEENSDSFGVEDMNVDNEEVGGVIEGEVIAKRIEAKDNNENKDDENNGIGFEDEEDEFDDSRKSNKELNGSNDGYNGVSSTLRMETNADSKALN